MNQHSVGWGLLLALSACSSACSVASEGADDPKPTDAVFDAAVTADASMASPSGQDAAAHSDASIRNDANVKDSSTADLACNGHVALCARRYNQVAYPATHNAHAAQAYGYSVLNANQLSGLDNQLDDGVRGFLMDVYEHNGQHVLCHGPCELKNTPHADWLNTLRTFLEDQPREVVTIIYQDGLAAEKIAQDFADAALDPYLYTHAVGDAWPTLAEMIAANTRLVVTAESGRPPPAWFQHVWDVAWDTPYEFRNASDFNCKLNRGAQDHPLFLVNHWLSSGLGSVYLPSEDGAKKANTYDVLYARLQRCRAETGQLPNFIAVDFYEHGDLFKAVAALNGF